MRRRYNQLLDKYYEEENEDRRKQLKEKIYQKYSINRYCRKCGQQLLISDLKEYKYLCLECDENFYEFETINRK